MTSIQTLAIASPKKPAKIVGALRARTGIKAGIQVDKTDFVVSPRRFLRRL